MNETRDTTQSPPPDVQPGSMSDRELLEHILGEVRSLRQDFETFKEDVSRRLRDGDERFKKIEGTMRSMSLVPVLHYLELAHRRLKNPEIAAEIRAHIDELHEDLEPPTVDRDEKTDPGFRPPPAP